MASLVAHSPLGGMDYSAMAAAQGFCPGVQKVAARPALQIRQVQIHGVDVLCDLLTGVDRQLVPAAFRTAVFAAIHGLAHPGIRATRCLVSSRFVWHGCTSDVAHPGIRATRRLVSSRFVWHGCASDVLGLPDLPEGEGDVAAGGGDTEHPDGSHTSTWIWWGPFPPRRRRSSTSLPSLTCQLNGLKPFRSKHGGGDSSRHFSRRLGQPLWCASGHHL